MSETPPGSGPERHLHPVVVVSVLAVALGMIALVAWRSVAPKQPRVRVTQAEGVETPSPLPPRAGQTTAPPANGDLQKRCTENLEAIFDALQRYGRDHPDAKTHNLPQSLTQLMGPYLTDREALVCPADPRGGESPALPESLEGHELMGTTRSYLFHSPLLGQGTGPDPMWGCATCTWEDWMAERDEYAPIIVCPHHAKDETLLGTRHRGPMLVLRMSGDVWASSYPADWPMTRY